MRKSFAYVLLLSMLGFTALLAQNKTPPAKLVLPSKTGNVTFDHSAHSTREKNECSVCHPALFAQDATSTLGYKAPHKRLETEKASCGSCHRADGSAFASSGNCSNGKCHVRANAK